MNPVNKLNHSVVFILNDQRYALYLSAVERVIHAVEITPLPKAPDIILGIINFQGRVIPVVNIHRRFRLPERDINLNDHIVISHTSKRTFALVVDAVSGVFELPGKDVIPVEEVLPSMEYIEGIVKLKDGMILIHDLEKFLSLEEKKSLDAVLQKT